MQNSILVTRTLVISKAGRPGRGHSILVSACPGYPAEGTVKWVCCRCYSEEKEKEEI